MPSAAEEYLADIRIQFSKLKKQVEDAIAQVSDDEMLVTLDPASNSIATIMRHMAGNLRSRFTDFLTTDGEKPDRDRDGEFDPPSLPTRPETITHWESGWSTLFKALDTLGPDDLMRDVFIRGERHSVIQAINRQLTHHSAHAGQVVFLAKHLRSEEWKTLTLPRKPR